MKKKRAAVAGCISRLGERCHGALQAAVSHSPSDIGVLSRVEPNLRRRKASLEAELLLIRSIELRQLRAKSSTCLSYLKKLKL
jgi:hypothetical protein